MATQEDIARYTALGWVLHPLSKPDDKGKSPGKRPISNDWQLFTKTPENLERDLNNGHNLGLVTGKASGVDGIDFDLDLFQDDVNRGVTMPETLISGHRDGRGHVFFQHRDDIFSEKHHFIGIEYFGNNAEGAGGNLVLPPSVHYSGDIYKWKNPDAPLAKMPDRLKDNLLMLFAKEDALHGYFKKCRHCFTKGSKKYDKTDVRSKGIWDRPDSIAVHGMDGRRAVLAIMGELKNKGCSDELMHMACKRFFGKDYSHEQTEEALKHIEPIPPKCETLRQYLNVECDGCAWRATEIISGVSVEGTNTVGTGNHDNEGNLVKVCGDCVFKPLRGAGGCRNPENEDKTTKTKRYTVYDTPACDKFKTPHVSTKASGCNSVQDDNDGPLIIYTARAIMAKYPIITLRDNLKEMYFYKDGVYIYGAEAIIREVAQTTLCEDTNKKRIGEIIYYIQNATFIDRDQINKDKNIINLKNGLYCLGTHELKPHTCTFISTCQIPVNYVPAATCPEIATFLCEVLRPRDVALILQEIGYCLIPDYSIQKAFLWNGAGLNGKGTLARLVGKFIGEGNKSSQSLKSLNLDKFSASNLYGKLVNIDTDLTNESITEDTMFKKLTGGDTISGERKFQDCFEFTNLARLLFGCNDIPQHIKGGDYAYFRRWIMTDFPVKFEGGSEDKDLDAKLQTPKELSGLLNVCLEALEWLLKTKTFFYNKTPEQVGDEYLLKSNSVLAFMQDCTIPTDDYIRTPDLYRAYQTWGKAKKIRKIEAINVFGKLMKQAGYIQGRPYSEDGKQTPAYEGVTVDYQKLAGLDVGLDSATLLKNNQVAYTHWFTKNTILSRVSRDKLLLYIIRMCIERDSVTDNDIIEYVYTTIGKIPCLPYLQKDDSDSGDTESLSRVQNGNSTHNIVGQSVQSIQLAGNRWQKLKSASITKANITEFCGWYNEQSDKSLTPPEIRSIAEKIYKLTPVTIDLVTVRVLKDVPVFKGRDDKDYHLLAGMITKIPEVNSRGLIKNGVVQQIQTDGDLLPLIRDIYVPFLDCAQAGGLPELRQQPSRKNVKRTPCRST